MHLVDNIIMAFLWAADFFEFVLHNIAAPIRTCAKDFLCIKIHKHAIFSVQRQTVVDGGVIFFVLDVFSDDPLVRGVRAVEAAIVQRGCHRACQMIQKQEILAHLIDFLRVMDMSVAEFVFGRIRARFDKIVFVSIKMEDFLAITVHDFLCNGIQRLETKAGKLQHGNRYAKNFCVRNLEKCAAVQSLYQRRKPEAHRVGVHLKHLISEVIKVEDVKTLTEHVVVEQFCAVVLCILEACVVLKQFLVRRLRNVNLHQLSGELRTEFFGVAFQLLVCNLCHKVAVGRVCHIIATAFRVVDVQTRFKHQFCDDAVNERIEFRWEVDLFVENCFDCSCIPLEHIFMQLSAFKNLCLIDLIKGFEGIRVSFEHCCKLLIGKRLIFLIG